MGQAALANPTRSSAIACAETGNKARTNSGNEISFGSLSFLRLGILLVRRRVIRAAFRRGFFERVLCRSFLRELLVIGRRVLRHAFIRDHSFVAFQRRQRSRKLWSSTLFRGFGL